MSNDKCLSAKNLFFDALRLTSDPERWSSSC
jgi:hypothetical protein